MKIPTHCRLCDGACGLIAETNGDEIVSLSGNPDDPVSAGFICSTATQSIGAIRSPMRITQPMKRVAGELVPSTWDEAYKSIGESLNAIRNSSGPKGISMVLGDEIRGSAFGYVRSLAFSLGMGTPNIFTSQCQNIETRLRIAEMMLGQATPLLSDITRAHYVVVLGGDQREVGWGPGHAGMSLEEGLEHSRKTKGTRVVVMGPRKTAIAEGAEQYLCIRPGTEWAALLGMLSAVVKGGWVDRQYIDDYTANSDKLAQVLEEWPLDRCAELCGLPPAELSGVALKFSRAAMSVVHPGYSTFSGPNASIGAWAWLTLHTLTANTLRPGGLYDHIAMFDLHGLTLGLASAQAPETRVGKHKLVMMQAPGSAFAEEVLTPGDGQVRACISVAGNPARDFPASHKVREALKDLELLVCLSRQEDETTAFADWVLPITHPWEREDLQLGTNNLLPVDAVAWTPALVSPAGESQPEHEILKELFTRVRPGIRGSSWGIHVSLLGQFLSRANLDTWQRRMIEWILTAEEVETLNTPPHQVLRGDSNRATWRVNRPDNRIDCLPAPVAKVLAGLRCPTEPADLPLRLLTSERMGTAPDDLHRGDAVDGIWVHPDTGFKNGERVKVATAVGELETVVHHDETVQAQTVRFPIGWNPDALTLIDSANADPISNCIPQDGIPCSVVAIKKRRKK